MIQRLQDGDVLKGLLVFAPFFLGITSLFAGINTGLIALILILSLAPVLYFSRKLFILPQQRLAYVLILSVSWLLIIRMLLDAEAYLLSDKIGLFLPLLIMNSFILISYESIFSMSDLKSAMGYFFKLGLAILLFFITFGILRELLHDISIFNSPAGFFFLSGFLFAVINFVNRKVSLIKSKSL